MRLLVLTCVLATGASCSIGESLAFKSTSKILQNAQPSLQMESDFELAKNAIPGALKTVEGFWVAGPPDDAAERFERILAEGYCQYGTGFIEDDWEQAQFDKNLSAIAYNNARATNV